ncbi:hypothetical protein EDB81DRAFT_397326 [Dactylonectria macrodidyma]|uniref:Uncharacterized protein n=1 Tax=Dactylonectria macrodidyma TaxID=307937 RepID=A0A9P9FAY0_9HYPO|nr:hypothetical protein EDB81DRAFT_397326 [Dactylonectria macrodidyma]
MTASVQTHGRSRSDSLQLMLELEKKMVNYRAQASTHHSHQSSPDSSVPPSPAPQPRRFELVPKDGKKVPPPVRNYGPVPPPLVLKEDKKLPPPPVRNYGVVLPPSPVPKDDKNAPQPSRNRDPMPAPLFCNAALVALAQSPAAMQRKTITKSPGHTRTASAPVVTSDPNAHKNVAFVFPPDVEEARSVCQSPSWEAYGRRKQEKKERKEERKEEKREEKREERRGREQEVKETKPRGRRLSKAPPLSQGMAAQGRSQTEPIPPKQKTRSTSLLGRSIGSRDKREDKDESEKPKRGRSGSLTSAIRHSFEIRRASWDQTSASGFLGGVKLDRKKQDFQQQVVDDQHNGTSKVHPALRKSFFGHGSFTPLKTPPQPSEEDKEAEAQRRACPPISILTSSVARNQSMKSPKSPARRNSANIYLWSARDKKKAASQEADECAVDDTEDEVEQATPDVPHMEESLYVKETGLTRRGGLHIKTGPPTALEAKTSSKKLAQENEGDTKTLNVADQSRSPRTTEVLDLGMNIASDQKDKTPYPPSSMKARPRLESTASTSSIAPEPPRRSSKRNSLGFLSRPSSSHSPTESTRDESSRTSKESLRSQGDKKSVIAKKPCGEKRNATPPSIRYETTSAGVRPTPFPVECSTSLHSKWSLKDTARSITGRGSSSSESISPVSTTGSFSKGGYSPTLPASPLKNEMTTQPNAGHISSQLKVSQRLNEHTAPGMAQSMDIRRPTTSSSDSSYSDALQSGSTPSTPNTSPPQSDSEHLPRMGGKQFEQHQYSPYQPPTGSPLFPPCDRFQLSDAPMSTDEELDPIEAAARKVMDAFSSANLRNPACSRQGLYSSDESIVASAPQVQPRLRHREKSKGRLRPSERQDNAHHQARPKASKSTPNLDGRGHRSSHSVPEFSTKTHGEGGPQGGDRVGKLFVICCGCKRYHDIPIKLYKAMANPEGVFSSSETMGFEGKVSMTVKCSWCDHDMSTKCCPGVSGILAIKERLH